MSESLIAELRADAERIGRKQGIDKERLSLWRAADALERLEAEVERCHERLEIDRTYRFEAGESVPVPVPMDQRHGVPDGIECRDETIRLQDENNARLRAQVEALRKALEEIATASVPDQPASSGDDEATWVRRHVGRLRFIADRALSAPADEISETDLAGGRTISKFKWETPAEARSAKPETGWLIEEWDSRSDVFKARWWALGLGESGEWTMDSTAGLRFAREADAQAYIDDIGWTEAKPTEHRWG